MRGEPARVVDVPRFAVPCDNARDQGFQFGNVGKSVLIDGWAVAVIEHIDRAACRLVGAAVGVETCAQLPGIKPERCLVFLARLEQCLRKGVEDRRSETAGMCENRDNLLRAFRRVAGAERFHGGNNGLIDDGHVLTGSLDSGRVDLSGPGLCCWDLHRGTFLLAARPVSRVSLPVEYPCRKHDRSTMRHFCVICRYPVLCSAARTSAEFRIPDTQL